MFLQCLGRLGAAVWIRQVKTELSGLLYCLCASRFALALGLRTSRSSRFGSASVRRSISARLNRQTARRIRPGFWSVHRLFIYRRCSKACVAWVSSLGVDREQRGCCRGGSGDHGGEPSYLFTVNLHVLIHITLHVAIV